MNHLRFRIGRGISSIRCFSSHSLQGKNITLPVLGVDKITGKQKFPHNPKLHALEYLESNMTLKLGTVLAVNSTYPNFESVFVSMGGAFSLVELPKHWVTALAEKHKDDSAFPRECLAEEFTKQWDEVQPECVGSTSIFWREYSTHHAFKLQYSDAAVNLLVSTPPLKDDGINAGNIRIACHLRPKTGTPFTVAMITQNVPKEKQSPTDVNIQEGWLYSDTTGSVTGALRLHQIALSQTNLSLDRVVRWGNTIKGRVYSTDAFCDAIPDIVKQKLIQQILNNSGESLFCGPDEYSELVSFEEFQSHVLEEEERQRNLEIEGLEAWADLMGYSFEEYEFKPFPEKQEVDAIADVELRKTTSWSCVYSGGKWLFDKT